MTDTMTLGNSTLANDLRLTPRAKKILRHLEKGKTITPLEALMVFQQVGSSLAGAVHELRNAGHDVITTMRQDANGHKYAEYQLNMRLKFN